METQQKNINGSLLQEANQIIQESLTQITQQQQFSLDSLQAAIEQFLLQVSLTNKSEEQEQNHLKQLIHNSPDSQYAQIVRLYLGAFKCAFVMQAQEVLNTECPSSCAIVRSVNSFLDDRQVLKSQEIDKFVKKNILSDSQILIYELSWLPVVLQEILSSQFFEVAEQTDSMDQMISFEVLAIFATKAVDKRIRAAISSSGSAQFLGGIPSLQLKKSLLITTWKLCNLITECVTALKEHLDKFAASTQKLAFPNRFLLVSLLKELSYKCHSLVNSKLEHSLLAMVDPTVAEKLASFIIQFSQTLNFKYPNNNPEEILQDLSMSIELMQQKENERQETHGSQFTEKIKVLLGDQMNENVRYREIIREDGQPGYMIKIKDMSSNFLISFATFPDKQYLIHLNNQCQIVIVDVLFLSSSWYEKNPGVSDKQITAEEFIAVSQDIQAIILQYQTAKDSDPNFKCSCLPEIKVKIPSQGSQIESSLGYCLANINKYSSDSTFLGDFGYSANEQGNLFQMAQQLPIIGLLFTVGGFGISTVKLANNKVANTSNKIGQMGKQINFFSFLSPKNDSKTFFRSTGKIALGTGSQIGSSISGAIIGQAAIPIPFFGGLIGGIIGGIIATVSSDYAIKKMNQSKFKKMINEIEKVMHSEGFWESNEQMYEILGITKEFFVSSIPEVLKENQEHDPESIWMTLNCFMLLSTFYAAEEQKERAELHKKIEKCSKTCDRQKLEEELEELYHWNAAVLSSHEWILQNEISLALLIQQIDEFVVQFVAKA